jgi:hypothetical protein
MKHAESAKANGRKTILASFALFKHKEETRGMITADIRGG